MRGYLFSGEVIPAIKIKNITSDMALMERDKIWKRLSIDNEVVPSGTLKLGLKQNGKPHVIVGEDIVSSTK